MKLISATHGDNDRLLIVGEDDDGTPVAALGWISATAKHYDPSSYDADGNLIDGATPRAMTPDEVRAYCQALLDSRRAAPVAPTTPTVITF